MIFFAGYFLLKGILPEPYFSHLMFFSSGSRKLYSRFVTEEADIDKAEQDIDFFLKMCTDDLMSYSNEILKPNTHSIAHLAEDRRLFGPLFKIVADGYENVLQIYKFSLKSRNIQIESLAKTIQLRFHFLFESDASSDGKTDVPKAAMRKVNPLYREKVKQKLADELDLNIDLSKSKFFDRLEVQGKKIVIQEYENRQTTVDCYVKYGDSFYTVIIFSM